MGFKREVEELTKGFGEKAGDRVGKGAEKIRRKYGEKSAERPKETTLKLPENYPETTRKIIERVRRKFGEKFGESSEKILEIILGNKNISAQEIAKHRSISSRAVEKQIAKLKKYGVLKRIGPAKGGYWKVYGQN